MHLCGHQLVASLAKIIKINPLQVLRMMYIWRRGWVGGGLPSQLVLFLISSAWPNLK